MEKERKLGLMLLLGLTDEKWKDELVPKWRTSTPNTNDTHAPHRQAGRAFVFVAIPKPKASPTQPNPTDVLCSQNDVQRFLHPILRALVSMIHKEDLKKRTSVLCLCFVVFSSLGGHVLCRPCLGWEGFIDDERGGENNKARREEKTEEGRRENKETR